jgi:DUF971 family protein
MLPIDIQPIGNELALKWEDGTETFLSLEELRRHCPCAGCRGEVDVMGQLHKAPAKPLTPAAFQLRGLARIGTYAIQPTWGDGHMSGIYSFDYLRHLAEAQAK